ncbi:MAG: hypothetical protein EB069_05965 [Actinobacteria bacterium]|nr:hypothetical protein [Actinomycetota bacterium]
MANNCWSQFSFFGNKKVIDQIEKWDRELTEFTSTAEGSECQSAVVRVFYAGLGDEPDLGSKWVSPLPDIADPGEIGFLSAWTPPRMLQDRVTALLFSLDSKVVVKNHYHTEAGEFGIRYTTAYDPENIYSQEAVVSEIDLGSGLSHEEIEGALGALLEEREKEIVEYLIDDVSGRSKKLKKRLAYLEIDWSEYD